MYTITFVDFLLDLMLHACLQLITYLWPCWFH